MPRINAATLAEHRAAQQRALLDAARELVSERGADFTLGAAQLVIVHTRQVIVHQ